MSAQADALKPFRVAEAYCYDAGAPNAAKNLRAAVADLIAERDALREACQTMADWDDAEINARPYAEDNGKAWRERLDLCALAFRRARAALALPTGESA